MRKLTQYIFPFFWTSSLLLSFTWVGASDLFQETPPAAAKMVTQPRGAKEAGSEASGKKSRFGYYAPPSAMEKFQEGAGSSPFTDPPPPPARLRYGKENERAFSRQVNQ